MQELSECLSVFCSKSQSEIPNLQNLTSVTGRSSFFYYFASSQVGILADWPACFLSYQVKWILMHFEICRNAGRRLLTLVCLVTVEASFQDGLEFAGILSWLNWFFSKVIQPWKFHEGMATWSEVMRFYFLPAGVPNSLEQIIHSLSLTRTFNATLFTYSIFSIVLKRTLRENDMFFRNLDTVACLVTRVVRGSFPSNCNPLGVLVSCWSKVLERRDWLIKMRRASPPVKTILIFQILFQMSSNVEMTRH